MQRKTKFRIAPLSKRGRKGHKGHKGRSSLETILLALTTLTALLYVLVFSSILVKTRNDKDVIISPTGNAEKETKMLSTTTSALLRTSNNKKKYNQVSCPDIIQKSKDKKMFDPNQDLEESPSRFTKTSPAFWISLHEKSFDGIRWRTIKMKGMYYENGLTEKFNEILSSTSTPGLVIDVGMNIGWFSLYAISLGHSVVAFEPNPIMHVRVCESLVLNGWDKDERMKIYPYGVGDKEGSMEFTTSKNPGASSLDKDHVKRPLDSMSVDVVKVDNVAKQEGWLDVNGLPIHLIKIDVEGYEYFVMKGGQELIASKRAANIIAEFTILDKAKGIDVFNNFYQSGYKMHAVMSVNGDTIAEVDLEATNKEISLISSRGSDFSYDNESSPNIHYMCTRGLNLWWVKTDDALIKIE